MTDPNPLEVPLDELWRRLSVLNGMLFLLDGQLRNFRTLFKEALGDRNVPMEHVWGGATLAVRDLDEWPEHGWAIHYPAANFYVKGEEYLQLVDRFVEREAAWAIAQAYEAFESFLYDLLAAAYLAGIPADPDKLLTVTRKLKGRGRPES